MSNSVKKLLSLLIVFAMVIAMVPVSGLQVSATNSSSTTNPGAAQAASGNAIQDQALEMVFPTDGTNADLYCPHCKETVTWEAKKISGTGGALSWGGTNETETGNHHIYVAGFTPTEDAPCTPGNFLTTNGTNYDSLCIHLNGYDLYTVGRMFINRAITVNVMGDGSINSVGELYGTTGTTVNAGFSLFDLAAAATLNLYGGTYTSTLGAVQNYYSSNSFYGTIRMTSTGTTVNMYDDVKLQPHSGTAVGMYRGIFNMYGGEISGGTGYPIHNGTVGAVAGGNVYMNGKVAAGTTACVFNQYYGTISGGDTTAYAGNGGGNIYVGYATFSSYSTISGGKANATAGFGGNIYGYTGGVLNLENGAQVTGTYTGASTDVVGAAYGGNIGSEGTFTINLKDGATVSNGYSTVRGGNIDFSGAGILNMTGGTVTGGHGKTGGNLYAQNNTADINISGGTISYGVSSTYGGNLYVTKSEVDIYGDATVTEGDSASGGGNIYFKGESDGASTLKIYGSAIISNGETTATANGGGNIFINGTADYATCEIYGNAQILEGKCTASGAYGGNIHCTNADLTISGGTISDGSTVAWKSTSNIYKTGVGTLTISGGSIAGDVLPYKGEFIISGAPTITSSANGSGVSMEGLSNGVKMNLGTMTGGNVCVTYPTDGTVFSVANANADSYVEAGYFSSKTGYDVFCNDNGELYIAEAEEEEEVTVKGSVTDDLKFLSDGVTAYCPVCKADATWTALTAGTAAKGTEAAGHYYLKTDLTSAVTSGNDALLQLKPGADGTYCLHLNGNDLTCTNSRAIFPYDGTTNIMGTGTVSGSAAGATGAAVHMNYGNAAATVNLYSGTYTKDVGAAAKTTGCTVYVGTGNLNIYKDAEINGNSTNYAPLYIGGTTEAKYAKVHMHGGTINGTTTNGTGGTVQFGTYGSQSAYGTFIMDDGIIQGGTAINGGNIGAWKGTITLNGGQILNGKADNGGNIYAAGSTLTIGDGTATGTEITVSGGNAGCKVNSSATEGWGGNVYVSGGTKATINAGALITGGNAGTTNFSTTSYGGNIEVSGTTTLTVNGGTITEGTAARGGNIDMGGAGTLYIKGGNITGGDAISAHGGNIFFQNASCTVELTGGSISGGTVASGKNGGNVCGQGGTVTIGSVNITGDVYISGSAVASITVKDAPTITMGNSYGLYVSTDLLTLGTMTGGSIHMTLNGTTGAFTNASENAEAYKGYFTCDDDYTIVNTDNVLYIVESTIDYVKGGFTDGIELIDGKGYCPACDAIVEWTELNTYNGGRIGYINFNTAYADGSTDKSLYEAGTPTCYHYYLSADLNCEVAAQYAERYYSNICINLNGHDLSFVGRMTFGTGCNVTIMGPAGSVVTSSGTYTNNGTHTEMICAQGKCDIYAGTYKCTNTSWPILAAKWGDAKVNLYEGVTFDGEKTARNTALIAVTGASTVDIEGATIQGGNNTTAALTNNDSASGYTYGGGDLIMGGNVAVWNGGTLNVNAGTITGGKCAGQGGNIYVFKGTVNIAKGATVTLGESATYGGNIGLDWGTATLNTAGNITNGQTTGAESAGSFGGNISATSASVVNITGGEISGGKSLNSQGGNIRVYGGSVAATLNISGDTVIKDGHASYESGSQVTDNVWIAGNVIMNFSGGDIYANEGDTSPASGLQAGPSGGYSPVIYLSGDASVHNNEDIGNIFAAADGDYHAKVIILGGWSGQASVKWPTSYATGDIPTTEGQAGTLTDGVFTAGNATYTGTLLCAPNGAGVACRDDGTLYLASLKGINADGSEVWVSELGGDYAYYKLMAKNNTLDLTEDTYVDLNGKNLITTGDGKLYGFDNTATLTAEGSAQASVGSDLAIDVTHPVTGERYIAITSSGKTTFHRLDMQLTKISLRTSKCGLYYKAVISCDPTLAEKVESFGVVYSLVDMPTATFDGTDVYTALDGESFVSGAEITSGSVFGIMKTYDEAYAYYIEKGYTETDAATAATNRVNNNAAYGEMEIYGNAYIVVNTDDSTENYSSDIITADTENGGKKSTDESFTEDGVAYSLLEVLQLVDQKWQTYVDKNDGTAEALKAFYATWKELGMGSWADKFTNLDA